MTIATWASLNNVTWTSLDGTPWTGGPLLPDELSEAQFIVEIAWGANVTADPGTWAWFEVTSDVLQSPALRLQLSKQQENQLAPPGSCTFTLRNDGNAYTPYAPLCSNYPNVKEGTPVRVKVVIAGVAFILFQGAVAAFIPAFDETGNYAVTSVQAAGPSRIDAKKTNPLASAMVRTIPTLGPAAYWPMEDQKNATSIASLVSGVPALSPLGNVKLAAQPGPGGSNNLPDFSSFDNLIFGNIGALPGFSSYWRFDIAVNVVNTTTGDAWQAVTVVTADGTQFSLGYSVALGGIYLTWIKSDGTNATIVSTQDPTADGWREWRVEATQSGGNVNLAISYDGTSIATGTMSSYTLTTISNIGSINGGGSGAPSVYAGQLVIFYHTVSTDTVAIMNGYPGEAPNTRAARLCAENNVQFSTVGFYQTDVTMGGQGIDTLLNLLRQCEAADGGVLYDGQSAGYQLQGISQRYDQFSQFSVDASIGHVQPPYSPTADDLTRVNSATITRVNGSTYTYDAESGPFTQDQIGTYAYQPNPINYQTDDFLANRARWEVFKGTIVGFRYPTITLNMRKLPSLAAAVAAMAPGLSFTVTPPYSAQLPTESFDLIAEGWTMTIVPTIQWDVTFNCSLQEAYNVWKIGDTQLGRLGTDGHTLAADAALGATSLSIATPTGAKLFTTDSGDMPMYLSISGLKIAVSNISGSSSPQTATVTGVTKALTNGTSITMWKNGVIKL